MNVKMNLILGVSNHIPNGAADEEFEALYNYNIRPLVSALYQFPQINMVFHYSGVLLYWIERNHPEIFVLLEDLLSRKQIELLGGGFYEPMMPFLPQADKIGQIEMLTTYIRKQFGKRPQGCWIPSHAWEQDLVSPLDACGMNYTFLNESYFQAAGAKLKQGYWYDPCITEDQGKIIIVFPVFSSLEEKKPGEILEKFLHYDGTDSFEGPITVFPVFNAALESRKHAFSGEKAETEYLKFFEELSNTNSQIEFTTPSRIYKNFLNLSKLYLNGLPVSSQNNNLIVPRQLLIDCPEAGLIYAKMIHTRLLINQLRGDKARKLSALEELWKAQDSSLFSHPGLANATVRKAAYRALLEAENITREKSTFSPSLSVFDYDLNGKDEYIFKDEKVSCYILSQGACLFELDYIPKAWNYLDTFLPSLGKRRSAFVEYLVPGTSLPEINWQGIKDARFCGEENFQIEELDRLRRLLCFYLPPKQGFPLCNIEIKKTWQLKRNVLSLKYELKNSGPDHENFFLIPMIDLSFSGGNESFLRILAIRGSLKEKINSTGQNELYLEELGGIEFRDLKNEAVLTLESNRQFSARIFNVEDIKDNNLYEYHFSCIMPVLPVSLESQKNLDILFTLKISS